MEWKWKTLKMDHLTGTRYAGIDNGVPGIINITAAGNGNIQLLWNLYTHIPRAAGSGGNLTGRNTLQVDTTAAADP